MGEDGWVGGCVLGDTHTQRHTETHRDTHTTHSPPPHTHTHTTHPPPPHTHTHPPPPLHTPRRCPRPA